MARNAFLDHDTAVGAGTHIDESAVVNSSSANLSMLEEDSQAVLPNNWN